MIKQTRWRQVDTFEPWNPAQKVDVHYTGLPGGYSSFYYNHEPNITNLMGPDMPYQRNHVPLQLLGGGSQLFAAQVQEVPEAYGTIPGVYGVVGGANFAVADINRVPEAYGTIPGVYNPLGDVTVTAVPGAYGRQPGIYDRKQHLEILLNGAMGLGDAAPMSTTTKILWIAGAAAVGAAAGWVSCSMWGRR
jgi:hypothetical protein